ncbi:unnamed protein product, partial [Amoebophrya sp. A120]
QSSTAPEIEQSENDRRTRGVLLQVATGEGKTELLAGVAVIMAVVYGKKVDSMTSSPVLAKRDAEKNANIYEQFGLRVAANTQDNQEKTGDGGNYLSDVTVGDPADFMFDALKSEWYADNTTGSR